MLIKEVDVAIIMGSRSDHDVMHHAVDTLQELNISYSYNVISAHRTPDRMYEFASGAEQAGLKVIIAGAGNAAHLPGMVASLTHVPVLGVPIDNGPLNGVDSLYSISQMPKGIPVATFAIGIPGSINAALFAASIIALQNKLAMQAVKAWKKKQSDEVPYEVI